MTPITHWANNLVRNFTDKISYNIIPIMVSLTLLYTGSKQNMDRLEQLFIEEKFHPLDPNLPPITDVLTIPLNSELQKKKRKCNNGRFNNYQ